MYMFGNILAP